MGLISGVQGYGTKQSVGGVDFRGTGVWTKQSVGGVDFRGTGVWTKQSVGGVDCVTQHCD